MRQRIPNPCLWIDEAITFALGPYSIAAALVTWLGDVTSVVAS